MRLTRSDIRPICYFPTTVLLIDDDVKYTEQVETKLMKDFVIKVENDSRKALDFLNHQYEPIMLFQCISRETTAPNTPIRLTLDISKIHQLAYNPNRFKHLTVILSDYSMPAYTGIDIFRKFEIQNTYGNPQPIRIILTGILNSPEKNLGDMEAYFNKSESIDKLIQFLFVYQKKYFIEAFSEVVNILNQDIKNNTLFFNDTEITKLMEKYITEHNIVENYLLDGQGSQLLLDAKANLSWFLIRNEKGMENTIEFAMKNNAPLEIIKSLRDRKKILYIGNEVQLKDNSFNWDDYLHTAHTYDGQEKYYYSFVNNLKYHGIDQNKILSYEDFLESIEN